MFISNTITRRKSLFSRSSLWRGDGMVNCSSAATATAALAEANIGGAEALADGLGVR